MYDRKKLTIKGRFSDVCFRQKMLSRPKDRSFTPPENLPGEGLKHTFIREKWRFSAFGQNASWAQIYPRNEKTDQKTGRWRILKMVDLFEAFQKFSLHLKTANFSSLKRAAISSSRKILREILSNSGRVSHLGNTAGRIPKLKYESSNFRAVRSCSSLRNKSI